MYIPAAMAKWEVPGLANAVVKDGKTIVARGYGVCELGKVCALLRRRAALAITSVHPSRVRCRGNPHVHQTAALLRNAADKS
jgi:hypothetical protein